MNYGFIQHGWLLAGLIMESEIEGRERKIEKPAETKTREHHKSVKKFDENDNSFLSYH